LWVSFKVAITLRVMGTLGQQTDLPPNPASHIANNLAQRIMGTITVRASPGVNAYVA